MEAEIDFQRLI